MEQGLIAAGIGVVVFLMGLIYGFSLGKRTGLSEGTKVGLEVGSVSVYAILIKAGIITIEYDENNKSNYTIYGEPENYITSRELIELIYNNNIVSKGE